MKRLLRTTCVLAILVLTTVFGEVGQAEGPAATPATPQSASDPILGAWKLNVDKSTNPPVSSELITIVLQGDNYKLTIEATHENGYNPRYELVTEMKGAIVKPIYADGKSTSDSWRVTRRGPNAFEMELLGPFGGWTDNYEVSADSKVLTLHRTPSKTRLIGGRIDRNGVIHTSEVVCIFERAL
jgi:hypothetical protein